MVEVNLRGASAVGRGVVEIVRTWHGRSALGGRDQAMQGRMIGTLRGGEVARRMTGVGDGSSLGKSTVAACSKSRYDRKGRERD